jgi:hypothetical protein
MKRHGWLFFIFLLAILQSCTNDVGNSDSSTSSNLSHDNSGSNQDNQNNNTDSGKLIPHYQARYFGGSDHERAQGNFVTDNFVVIAGNTLSTNYNNIFPPGTGGYKTIAPGGSNAYVAILSRDLSQVIAWTYFGGSGVDRAYTARIDSQGDILVSGWTQSTIFESQTVNGPKDAFVVKFSSDLKNLKWATVLGGSNEDSIRNALAIDTNDNIYVCGETKSADLSIYTNSNNPHSLQTSFGGGSTDGFMVKLDPQGKILWPSYMGGTGDDVFYSTPQIFSDGSVYFAGSSSSAAGLPVTSKAFQKNYGGGGRDIFVMRLLPDLTGLIYLTYLGGNGSDFLPANDPLALDKNGAAIILGNTDSTDFPTQSSSLQPSPSGSFDPTNNPDDAIISKISVDGSILMASTYFGGNGHEESSGVAVDSNGIIYVGGNTESTNLFVTADAFQSVHANQTAMSQPTHYSDAFFVKFNSDLSSAIFSTYFGGTGTDPTFFGDRIREVSLSPDETTVVASGDADSDDLPVNIGPPFGGGPTDGFVMNITFDVQ